MVLLALFAIAVVGGVLVNYYKSNKKEIDKKIGTMISDFIDVDYTK